MYFQKIFKFRKHRIKCSFRIIAGILSGPNALTVLYIYLNGVLILVYIYTIYYSLIFLCDLPNTRLSFNSFRSLSLPISFSNIDSIFINQSERIVLSHHHIFSLHSVYFFQRVVIFQSLLFESHCFILVCLVSTIV